jgi:hypothetical protein
LRSCQFRWCRWVGWTAVHAVAACLHLRICGPHVSFRSCASIKDARAQASGLVQTLWIHVYEQLSGKTVGHQVALYKSWLNFFDSSNLPVTVSRCLPHLRSRFCAWRQY